MLDCYLHERRERASARSSQSHAVIGEHWAFAQWPIKDRNLFQGGLRRRGNSSPEISY